MTLKLALQLKTASAIWQKAVKSFSSLSERLIRAVPLMIGGQSRGWVKAVFHFTRLVMRIKHNQGSKGLAVFLKANHLLIQRVLAGSKLQNPRDAGVAVSVTNRGVPRWIPVLHRKRLLRGDRTVVAFYLGLLTLYRVVDYRGKLSLSTVTDPGKEIDPFLMSSFREFLQTFIKWSFGFGIKPYLGVRDREDSAFWGDPKGLRGAIRLVAFTPVWKWMFTSGPNSYYSKVLAVGNAWIDMIAIHSRPRLFSIIHHMRAFIGASELTWLPWFDDVVKTSKNWSKICHASQTASGLNPQFSPDSEWCGGQEQFDVGKLSVVEEPGKKRIVAMVDIWTQWLLYPLHRFIFDKVLRLIPQDGTFNQAKPVRELLERASKAGRTHFWSYDLSAATDRLPIALQILVLGAFTLESFAHTWAVLLVDRDYRTPKEFGTTFGKGSTFVRYSVGQPMGAYSSWGMLAWTHHAIIQFAAWRCGHRSWFTWYAVLGDDVVICDRDVAAEYVHLMSEFGVGIGFHKSIISSNSTLEFAKRFYYKGKEISPLSLAGIAVGWLGPGFVPEVLSACEAKLGIELTLYQVARYIGVGFKAASAAPARVLTGLPRILSSTLLLLLRPGAPRGANSLLDWYLAVTMTGSSRAKIKVADEEKIFTLVWTEVVDSCLGPALKRVRSVVDNLFIPNNGKKGLRRQEHPMGDEFTTEYTAWFKSVIRPRFISKFRSAIDQAGDVLREAKKTWDRERNLAKALRLVESCLSILALVPTRINLVRRETEEVEISNAHVLTILIPRSVKRWRKVAKFVTRKAPPRIVRRKRSSKEAFEAHSVKRLSRF
jgi:hypothetical protein